MRTRNVFHDEDELSPVLLLIAGEWLCWPCRVHEEGLRAAGVPQKDIRPPRWELHACGPEGRRTLEGGSLAAECALCPIRQGAFRQTVDTHQWVHQVGSTYSCSRLCVASAGCDAFFFLVLLQYSLQGMPRHICHSLSIASYECLHMIDLSKEASLWREQRQTVWLSAEHRGRTVGPQLAAALLPWLHALLACALTAALGERRRLSLHSVHLLIQ